MFRALEPCARSCPNGICMSVVAPPAQSCQLCLTHVEPMPLRRLAQRDRQQWKRPGSDSGARLRCMQADQQASGERALVRCLNGRGNGIYPPPHATHTSGATERPREHVPERKAGPLRDLLRDMAYRTTDAGDGRRRNETYLLLGRASQINTADPASRSYS